MPPFVLEVHSLKESRPMTWGYVCPLSVHAAAGMAEAELTGTIRTFLIVYIRGADQIR